MNKSEITISDVGLALCQIDIEIHKNEMEISALRNQIKMLESNIQSRKTLNFELRQAADKILKRYKID